MNIFVLDKDPVLAAKYQCDKHVVKMCLETAQILCTALRRYGVDTPYKAAHKNHPCTLWAGDSLTNFLWLYDHGVALCKEYTLRYGKVHKSEAVINSTLDKSGILPSKGPTPFAQAMPEVYKDECPVTAYRNYYLGEKLVFSKWKTQTPYWVKKVVDLGYQG
jgi:hypothetical protein